METLSELIRVILNTDISFSDRGHSNVFVLLIFMYIVSMTTVDHESPSLSFGSLPWGKTKDNKESL